MPTPFQLLTSPDPYDFVGRQIQLTGIFMILVFGFLIAFFSGKYNDNILIALAGMTPLIAIAVLYFKRLVSLAKDDLEFRTEMFRRYESSGLARKYEEVTA
jgi:hypothetical protein